VVVNLAYPLTEKNWKKEKAKRHPEMALVIAVAIFHPAKYLLERSNILFLQPKKRSAEGISYRFIF